MALVKFELKKEHIAMIKAIKWDEYAAAIFTQEYTTSPFGGDDLVEDLGLIIYGMPKKLTEEELKIYHYALDNYKELEDDVDANRVIDEFGVVKYSPEQVSEMMCLYEELPLALEIYLNLESNISAGHYKRRTFNNEWMWDKKKNIL